MSGRESVASSNMSSDEGMSFNSGMDSNQFSGMSSEDATFRIASDMSSLSMSGAYSGAYSGASGLDSQFSQGSFEGRIDKYDWSKGRTWLYRFIDSKWFSGSILFVIFLNTVLIAVQTDASIEIKAGWYFEVVDNVFLGIYVFELVAKLFVWRWYFFKMGWNVFDMFIVITSFIEYIQYAIASFSVINPRIFRLLRVFRAIRALRALRVLRTISFLNSLQVIVNTLLNSIPAMGHVLLLLLLVIYIFAIIGRQLYGEIYPERFSTIFRAFFALFQLITLDDWFEYYTIISPHDSSVLLYLIIYILLATFILINLFIAVIVSSLEATQSRQKKMDKKDRKQRRKEAKEAEREELIMAGQLMRAETSKNVLSDLIDRDEEDFLGRDNSAEFYYGSRSLPNKTRAEVGYYFMLLAGLEDNYSQNMGRVQVLDTLTDLIDAKPQESE
eukprot:TRINITY_DN1922_c0_g1_i5.p1 TRINITY_DN1922_c0_g1~~TRINITY_DN1922_c0_g1_i5.p1  ORF type:complete len:443 (+),score=66.30 TRINITY_DN1922_c0_g1_i5:325-1653(+)